MKNKIGKIFEDQFQKSMPDYALLHRLPDDAQSFGGSSRLRFSKKNPFDFLLWDSKKHILYSLELKTVKEKSISFERTKEDKAIIHYHQIKGLERWSKYDGIISGFIIEFRKIETTIFIDIDSFLRLIEMIDKKSFNMEDLAKNQIPYFIIPQEKQRTRYLYDIDRFLADDKKFIKKKCGGKK